MSELVRLYYDNNVEREWLRLSDPYGRIEYSTTLHLIEKYFPKTGSIIDIGCGPGRYSIELLKKGYETTLFELSDELLTFAKLKIQEENLKVYLRRRKRFNPVQRGKQLVLGIYFGKIGTYLVMLGILECYRKYKNEGEIGHASWVKRY